MVDNEIPPSKPKRGRKPRVPGSDNPPRESFVLRLEKQLLDELNEALKYSPRSRNEFISEVIKNELKHMARFRELNVGADPFTVASLKRRKADKSTD